MVSPKTRAVLWARGAGRCHYCNTSLIGDYISGNEDANFGFVAHIVADKPTGPRGDPVRSSLLEDDVSNLMLMCYPHHKLIDRDELDQYPEQRLLDMKAGHEERIRILTDVTQDRSSHVLRYGAKIGAHDSPVSFSRVRQAMLPERYPSEGRSIGIGIIGNIATDGEEKFWSVESDNLKRQFQRLIAERIAAREIEHLSVFALGPIPLLVELGSLLGDITPADVYQLHREQAGWRWAENGPRITYVRRRAAEIKPKVALKLGISATVTDDRITSILGDDVSIWSLTVENPNNDIMRYAADLAEYRKQIRCLFDEIKAAHGQSAVINVFPAIPVSCAVETGRVRMPKADLPLVIFDQVPNKGFISRLTIG
ncbi:HNH endonuclease [Bradyrhizobium sp. CAR08]